MSTTAAALFKPKREYKDRSENRRSAADSKLLPSPSRKKKERVITHIEVEKKKKVEGKCDEKKSSTTTKSARSSKEEKKKNDGNLRVLVLGMGFLSNSAFATYLKTTRRGTTNAYVRDRVRLVALRASLPVGSQVVSLNRDLSESESEPGCHIQATIAASSAKLVAERFRNRQLDMILLDYIRFPASYMTAAYNSVLSSLLPALVANGSIGLRTRILIPNLRTSVWSLGGEYEEIPMMRSNLLRDHPLFAATENAAAEWREKDERVFGGITNEIEIRQLDGNVPFSVLQLTKAKN